MGVVYAAMLTLTDRADEAATFEARASAISAAPVGR